MLKFSCNLNFQFGEGPNILERYELAKNAGFKAVECSFPLGFTIEQVQNAKESAGIEQILINMKADEADPIVTAIPGKENNFKSALATTVQYAKALNAKKIHIWAGSIEKPTKANWTTYENNLKYAAGILKKENLIGLIEPINQHRMPNYLLCDYQTAIDIIKRIDSPHLRLQLDIYHLQQIQGDITRSIAKYMPYIGHVQIGQVPDRHEPDSPGEINYEYVLQQLTAHGYNDWVGLEYTPQGKLENSLAWIQKYGYSL